MKRNFKLIWKSLKNIVQKLVLGIRRITIKIINKAKKFCLINVSERKN